jgi:hypothetical protein
MAACELVGWLIGSLEGAMTEGVAGGLKEWHAGMKLTRVIWIADNGTLYARMDAVLLSTWGPIACIQARPPGSA